MTPTQDNRSTRDTGFAGTARQRAIDAYESAGKRAADSFEQAPLIALAGGLAAGALIAALLPRTRAETKAFRPVGDKLTESAKAAAAAAKQAGTTRLEELGLTREKGAETLRALFEGAGDAAKTSAQAALSAARNRE